MASGIYAICHTQKHEAYVGQSNNFQRRFGEHRKRLRRGIHECSRLQNSFNKHGEEAFKFIVLGEISANDKELITLAEQEFIDEMSKTHDLYNTATVAASNHGIKFTEEQRSRMGGWNRGKSSPMKGKRHSEEARAKMSAALKGRVSTWKGKKASPETKQKMSIAKLGKKQTPKSNAKRSEAMKLYRARQSKEIIMSPISKETYDG